MPETLNEKALEAAKQYARNEMVLILDSGIEGLIRTYLSSLPAGDYAGLVERLMKRAHPMSTFGANLFNPDGEEAATAITALVAERDAERTAREAAEARVKAMDEALGMAERAMTKDSFCEAERLEEGLRIIRRARAVKEGE